MINQPRVGEGLRMHLRACGRVESLSRSRQPPGGVGKVTVKVFRRGLKGKLNKGGWGGVIKGSQGLIEHSDDRLSE